MATAQYVKLGFTDPSGVKKSSAVVSVNGAEIAVEFWYDIIAQWGKDQVKTFLCAEALWLTGNYADVHKLLEKSASGEVGVDEDGKPVDTRNWQKNYLDHHPLPVAVTDPLK